MSHPMTADDVWDFIKDLMEIADGASEDVAYPADTRDVKTMIDVASERAFLRALDRRNAMVMIYGHLHDLLNDEEKADDLAAYYAAEKKS